MDTGEVSNNAIAIDLVCVREYVAFGKEEIWKQPDQR